MSHGGPCSIRGLPIDRQIKPPRLAACSNDKETMNSADRILSIQPIVKRLFIVDQSKFLKVADEAADHLRCLMQQFPHLATSDIKAVVDNWGSFKQRRCSIETTKPEHKMIDQELLLHTAIRLLEDHQMEDVIELLCDQFSLEMDYSRFIGLIGKTRYRQALRHEARELQSNSISFEQMADLWNSMAKPAFGWRPLDRPQRFDARRVVCQDYLGIR